MILWGQLLLLGTMLLQWLLLPCMTQLLSAPSNTRNQNPSW
jgi:hypothetical protein